MKFLIRMLLLSLPLISPIYLFAEEENYGERVCQRIRNQELKQDCFNVVENSYFQVKPVKICIKMTLDMNKLDCVTAIKNKEYLSSELRVVKGQQSDQRKNLWLQKLGNPI